MVMWARYLLRRVYCLELRMRLRLLPWIALIGLLWSFGCDEGDPGTLALGGDDEEEEEVVDPDPLPEPEVDTGVPPIQDPTPDAGRMDASMEDVEEDAAMDATMGDGAMDDAGDAMSAMATCGDNDCGLNGDCVVDSDTGEPTCVCDEGYVQQDGAQGGVCVEDTTCVDLTTVECRMSPSDGNAVGMVVSATYCSGNPVPDLDASDLQLEERGATEWEVPGVESSLTVLQRDYLAHVYLVLDMSASVVTSGVLPQVKMGIETLLDRLEDGGQPARVAILLFDGTPGLYEFQAETGDFAAIRARLSELESFSGYDATSTDLYGAAVKGLNRVEGRILLKYRSQEFGFLATSTLVIVSDGDDDAARYQASFVRNRFDSSSAQIITVGLGDEADLEELTQLGRNGSYAAPSEQRVVEAFGDIGQRVVQYPDTLYFIGYCSPRRAGALAARVRLTSQGVTSSECGFQADYYSGTCSQDVFDPAIECTAPRECGGILGCGTCPQGQACFGGVCQPADGLGATETCGAHWMCAAPRNCTLSTCSSAATVDDVCSDSVSCDVGAAYCSDAISGTCLAAKANGSECDSNPECESGYCAWHPGTSTGPKLCRHPIHMYDNCAAGGLPCEPGTYCSWCQTVSSSACTGSQDWICLPLKSAGSQCVSHGECFSGSCPIDSCAGITSPYLSIAP